MDGSQGPDGEALERARLVRELNENALRELALLVRIDELERDRWAAFSLVELEWISTATVDPDGDAPAETLPGQANAELDGARARAPGSTTTSMPISPCEGPSATPTLDFVRFAGGDGDRRPVEALGVRAQGLLLFSTPKHPTRPNHEGAHD